MLIERVELGGDGDDRQSVSSIPRTATKRILLNRWLETTLCAYGAVSIGQSACLASLLRLDKVSKMNVPVTGLIVRYIPSRVELVAHHLCSSCSLSANSVLHVVSRKSAYRLGCFI